MSEDGRSEDVAAPEPDVVDRIDTELDDMAKPTDPDAMAASIATKAGDRRAT